MSEFERKVARVKRACNRYAIARVNKSWNGNLMPDDKKAIENELRLARTNLDKVIRECI